MEEGIQEQIKKIQTREQEVTKQLEKKKQTIIERKQDRLHR